MNDHELEELVQHIAEYYGYQFNEKPSIGEDIEEEEATRYKFAIGSRLNENTTYQELFLNFKKGIDQMKRIMAHIDSSGLFFKTEKRLAIKRCYIKITDEDNKKYLGIKFYYWD